MGARGSRQGALAAPVEYAVAVDRYLDAARLSAGSRRVYRISLSTWSWLLVERTPPQGAERRNARTPVVPLARIDGPGAAERLRAARERRALMVDARTVERESAILRSAVDWWVGQGWVEAGGGDGLRSADEGGRGFELVHAGGVGGAAIPGGAAGIDVRAVFALRAALREQTLWQLIFESAAPVEHILALDVSDLDFAGRRVRRRIAAGPGELVKWGDGAAALLPLLVAGRHHGPVFLTERRASGGTPAADRCPHTGRGRLSGRRAAEVFRAATAPLDPAGHGWTLRDLRVAGRAARGLRVRAS